MFLPRLKRTTDYEVAVAAARIAADPGLLRRRSAKPAMIRASAATPTGAAQGIHPAATRNLPAAAMMATSDRVESRRVICELALLGGVGGGLAPARLVQDLGLVLVSIS